MVIKSEQTPARRRYERYFFSAMAGLILATVFLGFAKTYFLAGMFLAPLPNWVIHLHGAAFTLAIRILLDGKTDSRRRAFATHYCSAEFASISEELQHRRTDRLRENRGRADRQHQNFPRRRAC